MIDQSETGSSQSSIMFITLTTTNSKPLEAIIMIDQSKTGISQESIMFITLFSLIANHLNESL
jgi:hypothetical protein